MTRADVLEITSSLHFLQSIGWFALGFWIFGGDVEDVLSFWRIVGVRAAYLGVINDVAARRRRRYEAQ